VNLIFFQASKKDKFTPERFDRFKMEEKFLYDEK